MRFGASFAPKGKGGAGAYSAPTTPESVFASNRGADGARARCSRCSCSGTCTCTARRVITSPRSRSPRATTRSARPTSLMQEPLTREDYFDARMISEPFCLYDYCMECDGAVAVVTTTPERAKRPAAPAGARHGLGERRRAGGGARRSPGWACPTSTSRRRATGRSRRRLYEMAGVGPDDVDVALLYDHFTGMVLLQLEDYGFCGIGESGAVRRRRQHPLARRRAAGEHARRQPLRGVHHRHDAREGSRRAAARHRGQPGRRTRRSRSSPAAPRRSRSPACSCTAELRGDAMTTHPEHRPAAERARLLHAERCDRAVLGRGRASTGSSCPAASSCGTFRFPPAAFCWTCRAQDVEWIEHDGDGDALLVHRHPPRGDPERRRRAAARHRRGRAARTRTGAGSSAT